MKRIATLTVNPTIDKYTSIDEIEPERKLRCERPRREPGGGGLNVARAIRRLEGSATALYMAGGPTGDMLHGLLEEEGVDQKIIPIDNWTRENLIVYETSSDQQYRFGMPGPVIREDEWRRCLTEVAALNPKPDYLAVSGSLAPGIPDDFYGRIAEVARDIDARLVVDTSGEALRAAVDAGVYLLKPNLQEFQYLIGEELTNVQDQIEAARQLIAEGCCHVVVLSLGEHGALTITSDDDAQLSAPKVSVQSQVGAGDSMVGGIILGLAEGMSIIDAVGYGITAGAAAVMTPGTELSRLEDTETLYKNTGRRSSRPGHSSSRH